MAEENTNNNSLKSVIDDLKNLNKDVGGYGSLLLGEMKDRMSNAIGFSNLGNSIIPAMNQNDFLGERNLNENKTENKSEDYDYKPDSEDYDYKPLLDFEEQLISILESQNTYLVMMTEDLRSMIEISSPFYANELKKYSSEVNDEKEDDKEHSENQKQASKTNSLLSNVFSFFQRDREERKFKEEEDAAENKNKDKISDKENRTAKSRSKDSAFSGIGGFLQNLLKGISTAFLGKGFTNFITGLLPKSLGKGAFLPIMRTLSAALIGPEFVSALMKGLESEDVASGITTFLDEFFKKGDVYSNLLKGAAAGLVVGGPKGLIAGALIAGAWTGLTNVLDGMGMSEKDQTSLKNQITGFLFGPEGGAILGAALGFKAFGVPGALIGAAVMSVGGLVGKVITNYNNQEGDDKSIGEAIKKSILENPLLTGIAGSTLGGTIGLVAGGPAGAIAGFLIGAAVSSAAILVSDVINNYQNQKGEKSIGSAIAKTLLNHPKLAGATVGAMGGALAGLVAGGPVGMIAGILIGGTVGLLAGMLAEFLEEIGVGRKIRNMLNRVKTAYDLIEDSIFNIDDAWEVLTGKQATDKGQIGEMVDAGEADMAIRSLMKTSGKFSEENIEQYDIANESYKKAKDVVDSIGDTDYAKAFMKYINSNNITMRDALKDPSMIQNFQFKRGDSDISNGLYSIEQASLRQYLALSSDLEKRQATLQYQQEQILSRMGAKDVNLDTATNDELKDILYKVIEQREAPPVAPAKATGGYFDKPQLVFVGENTNTNPEILFNRQQLQALGEIFKMQNDNDNLRMRMTSPTMPPMPQPNIVDNKNITVQETFNVTEVLPAPSSHVSFRDNILGY